MTPQVKISTEGFDSWLIAMNRIAAALERIADALEEVR
jgi:hypothetical protein